jgi:hypothetical protein
VGVTVSPVAIEFLREGCELSVAPSCGDRYASLSMPEPGQAYEMVSQIVSLLRSDAPHNPLPPRFRRRIDRLFHVGQSQQASDVTTYAWEFHFELNDGYFMQAQAVGGKPLSSDSPSFPLRDPRALPPTNLPVPVVRAQTETDLAFLPIRVARQVGADTDTFRYYEMAGVAHNTVSNAEVSRTDAGEPILLGDLCIRPMNTGADGPVFGRYLYAAMWRNLERQVRHVVQPPHGEPILFDADGQIVRDAFGNAVGGVRLPAIQVPLASYGPINAPKPACGAAGAPDPPGCLPPEVPPVIALACLLSGSVTPFADETLDALYPSRLHYLLPVLFASLDLRQQGFLLRPDQRELLQRAREAGVGGDGGR